MARSVQEIEKFRENSLARKAANNAQVGSINLKNALEEQQLKNQGAANVANIEQTGANTRDARKQGYYDSQAAVGNAQASGLTLENTLRDKTLGSTIAAANAGNRADAFRHSLDHAKGKQEAMNRKFAVDFAGNKAGVSDAMVDNYTQAMDDQNELAVRNSNQQVITAPGSSIVTTGPKPVTAAESKPVTKETQVDSMSPSVKRRRIVTGAMS
jgi:hypothetical protein